MIRFTLVLLFCACLFSCQVTKDESTSGTLVEAVDSLYTEARWPFYHGVASGDPLADRVIIWTRVTPKEKLRSISVKWDISETQDFSNILQSDTTSTSPERDYTVKVDVQGLQPGKFYYYRFTALDKTSAAGRTKTLGDGNIDSLRFAVVSCANWEFGYFNAFSRIAEKEVDAVVHLGDYIYEYARGRYGNKDIDRKHLPANEIVTLQDYRIRYSQYHLDEGLRAARTRHPFIAVWDDHEVANNVYATGAQNHQAEAEGDFSQRKAAARQAYYEWIPIRESEKHYRSFKFGNLASLIMLDERLEARMKQLDSISDPALFDKDRTMLGAEQVQWFESELTKAGSGWKVIGNQVIFSDLDQSLTSKRNPRNLDSWDGYPAEKKRIGDFIRSNSVKDVVFLAGDTHSSWAFEVCINPATTYNKSTSEGAFAVEFGTTSISSSNSNESAPDDSVKMKEQRLLKANPHLKFTNHRDHGYLMLTLTPPQARAEWFYINTLHKPDDGERLEKALTVAKGRFTLK